MRVLIIYATNSGSTFLVSEIIAKEFIASKHSVVIKLAAEVTPSDLTASEVVLWGSPSWDYKGEEGCPHHQIIALMERWKAENFTGWPMAIFGCGDSSYTYFCGAVDHLEKFITERGSVLICPSLRIDGFYFTQAANCGLAHLWAEQLILALKYF